MEERFFKIFSARILEIEVIYRVIYKNWEKNIDDYKDIIVKLQKKHGLYYVKK